MSKVHSVEAHLRLNISDYDRIIRTFIPGYDTMLNTIVDHLINSLPKNSVIVDLGGGTGSLAYALAEKFPGARIELRDIDPNMIAIAQQRLSEYRIRIQFEEKSFHEPLPPCNAVVASISLHHINSLESKTKLYSI